MKSIVNVLAMVISAIIAAAAVIYAWENCPNRKAKEQQYISDLIGKYISENPNEVLERLAKSENFSNTIKNFSSFSDEELKNKITEIIKNNPDIFINNIEANSDVLAEVVMESEKFSKNSVSAPVEEVKEAPKNNPNQIYIDHWDELKNHKAMPFIGPKDAKVTVVEFFDFACGHCKALAPIMSRLIQNNPDVKFVFAPLYFMSAHSPYAAKASLAAHKKGKYLGVYEGLLTLPEINEKSIEQILVDEGLNINEIKKMIEEKDIRRGIQDIDSLSQVLGINGVPLILINGENFYGRSLEDLQNKLNSLK